jgi:DNA mismatch repair protein MutS
LFKGLSTFAVEMSELRTILNMSDENSMILGDELCSGTETESAISIFVAGLQDLYEKRTSFIFATHFHEIVDFEEIRQMETMKVQHMSVHFDYELYALVYDRKLRDGPGSRTYGLEVCKSLYLPEYFLKRAYDIRSKYFPETKGSLGLSPSTYNATKLRGLCELCNENLGEEIHHIQQQKDADENGFIGNVHKNHAANLLSVCKKCHDSIHHSPSGSLNNNLEKTKKKTTKGYKLV